MDAIEFLERIKVIALYFNSLSDAEIKAIKKWIKNTVVDPLAESAIKILEADKREVELMVFELLRVFFKKSCFFIFIKNYINQLYLYFIMNN